MKSIKLEEYFDWQENLESAICAVSDASWGADILTVEQANLEQVELGIEDQYAEDENAEIK